MGVYGLQCLPSHRCAGGPRRRQFDLNGKRLGTIDWNGENIVPVRKVFLQNHPQVQNLSREQCDMVRLRLGIEVQSATTQEVPKPVERLEEAPFPDWAFSVLCEKCWKEPTPIQVQGWPVALSGHDVIGIATTGSGKTMAYVLPMLVHIMAQPELQPGEGPVGLVLVPQRELCEQVAREVKAFSIYTNLVCQSIYGGVDQEQQAQAFLGRVDVLVSTPGRLIDMLKSRQTNLRRATYVVVDEADELLHDKFQEQVELVVSQVRPDRQMLLFSATMQDHVRDFAERICHCDPIKIRVGGGELAACRDVHQHFLCAGRGDGWKEGETKLEVLSRAVGRIERSLREGRSSALIFCNRSESVNEVFFALRAKGVTCERFTGECCQATRAEILKGFSTPGTGLNLLVCTSILGRGHDFQNVRYVVNYDMPRHIVEYVHRVGRTGRMGVRGVALTLLEDLDLRFAKVLSELLVASGQETPPWLEEESSKRKISMRWSRYYGRDVVQEHKQRAADEVAPAAISGGWKGRGRGRRHVFLAECEGRGVARGAAVLDI